MKLSEELKWRGFINQTTFADISDIDNQKITFYFGVDPSADSMTVGNLASVMMIRHFLEAGHPGYLLVGGATGMIGDPDGKKTERELMSLDEIAANKQKIADQYSKLLNGMSFNIVDNLDWFRDISYLDFLRNIGKYVPLSTMLGREFVQSRLGESGAGISYAEFSYSLIQGYDFLHLHRQYGVSLQLCGADQWGNSITGVDMIRRLEGVEANVLSTPLVINRTTGRKFGKSEDGAIWLDDTKTSVYKFYQFWLNIDDAGVVDYAKIYTMLDRDAIAEMERQVAEHPEARQAQRTLAHEVTTIVHGAERTASAEKVTEVLFGGRSIEELNQDELDMLAAEIPVGKIGETIVGILVSTGVADSNGAARRLIAGGGISINGQKIADDFTIEKVSLIKKGKNNFVVVK